MKKIYAALLIGIGCFIFYSCQKELDYPTDGVSVGTLKANGTGDCLPSNVNGIYKENVSLTDTNYIDVQINISSPGTYHITSDTLNGYSFAKAGTIGVTGLQTIRLYGSGKPVVAGLNQFTISYGNSSCKINVTVIGASTGAAVFTLSGAPDTCANFIVNGNFLVGQAATAAELLTVTVDVTTIGTYTLTTSVADNVSFSGTGVFTTTGLQNVTLNASGTPTTAGDKFVNVLGAVSCPIKFVVTAASSQAVFTYNGAGGACTGAVINGNYVAGTALSASHTATLQVNVTQAGSYNISLPAVNGITFTASGNFAGAGPASIVFTGSGTPAAAGTFNFAAACTFSVTVTSGPVNPPANEEYLPMTTNTNFKFELVGGNPEDTSHLLVLPNNITYSGNSYRIFQGSADGAIEDSTFYRKNAGKYYQYHVNSFGLDHPFNKDGMVLDSNLAVNAVWTVDLGTNTVNGTTPVAIKYEGKILEKNAAATVGGVAYTKIIKVLLTYKGSAMGMPFQDVLQHELWFAKGKGIIYQKINDVPPTSTDEIITKNIYVAP